MKSLFAFFSTVTLVLYSCISLANCNCESQDENSPCLSNELSVVVKAGTPNGGIAKDAIFTWKFNSGQQKAYCGKFANGDYWVAPYNGYDSVTITSISGSGKISADANPIPEKTGILGNDNKYGNYSVEEDLMLQLPVDFTETTPILAAIQRDENVEGKCGTSAILGACVDAYNVLTILPKVPPMLGADSIRPNITGKSKEMLRISDFDLSRIPSMDIFSPASNSSLERIQATWTHSTEIFGVFSAARAAGWSEGGRAFRSHILVDDYGAGTGVLLGSDIMMLFSSQLSVEEKIPSLAAILAYGHDIFKAVYDPQDGIERWFGVGASQSAGRYPVAALFASLAKDPKYSLKIQKAGIEGQGMASIGPHELTQIQKGVDGPVWGDVIFGYLEEGAYWGSLLKSQCYDEAIGSCTVSSGKRTGRDPYLYIDGPPNMPGAGYMTSSLGGQKFLAALMLLIPEVCETVNYPELIEYIDRVTNYGIKTVHDPCVTPDSRENLSTCDPYRNTGCDYYKLTWGPDPTNSGECIKVPSPPYTKVGRFSALDKKPVSVSYKVSQIEINWPLIRGTQVSCEKPKSLKKPTGFKVLVD